jgi:hypothetical protein
MIASMSYDCTFDEERQTMDRGNPLPIGRLPIGADEIKIDPFQVPQ